MPNDAEFLHQIVQTSRPRPSADRSYTNFLERELERIYAQNVAWANELWETRIPPTASSGFSPSTTDPWTIVRGPY